MAVTITPLGFRVPDGNELVRSGDNDIAANGLKAQELLGNALPRLAVVESAAFAAGTIPLIEDPEDPGFYILANPE